MFIFITPRIIRDPVDDLRRIRQCEYQKRAGDIPEFLMRSTKRKKSNGLVFSGTALKYCLICIEADRSMSKEKEAAERFGIPILEEIGSFPLVRGQISIIPYLLAKQRRLLPVEQNEKGVTVAVSDPLDIDSLEELRLLLKKPIFPIYCPLGSIEAAIERCYQQKEEETKRLFSDLEKGTSTSADEEILEGYDLLEQGDQNPIVRMVNAILVEAIQQGASDIHFEPTEEGLSIRYRIDGVLQKRHVPPRDYQTQILTRIKVMAKMDIAEHRLPQDGRIKLRHGGREIDFRVSTLPIVHGERIVLRILDKGNVLLGLDTDRDG